MRLWILSFSVLILVVLAMRRLPPCHRSSRMHSLPGMQQQSPTAYRADAAESEG